MNSIYNLISELAKRFGASKVVLFGSKARGDNIERSDIDIAVYGVENSNQAAPALYLVFQPIERKPPPPQEWNNPLRKRNNPLRKRNILLRKTT